MARLHRGATDRQVTAGTALLALADGDREVCGFFGSINFDANRHSVPSKWIVVGKSARQYYPKYLHSIGIFFL